MIFVFFKSVKGVVGWGGVGWGGVWWGGVGWGGVGCGVNMLVERAPAILESGF